LNVSVVVAPIEEAFNGLPQAAHAPVVVLFERAQFFAFWFFVGRPQARVLRRELRLKLGIQIRAIGKECVFR
jgi:hypothetical protein